MWDCGIIRGVMGVKDYGDCGIIWCEKYRHVYTINNNIYILKLLWKYMAETNERKAPGEIKSKILGALNDRPLSAQDIGKAIGSNWSTVKNYVQELVGEKKVKEIIATDKITYYQKITETYYNIPITKKQEDLFKFLFSSIIREYKNIKSSPNRTQLAKDSVEVINELKLDLPTAWYIYGQIPLMIPDPTKEFTTSFVPENAKQIGEIISKIVSKFNGMKVKERQQDHYVQYDNHLYIIKKSLLEELGLMNNKKKILELFSQFYIKCPVSDFPDLFDLTERLNLTVNKLALLDLLEKYKVEAILSLESLWKFVASYQLLKSLSRNPQFKEDEIMQFNIGPAIETKKYCAEEAISNLESIYLSELPNKEVDISEGAKGIREIMSEWTGE